MDQPMVGVVDRPGEFAADQIMRQVGGQPQVRKAIEKLQGEEQIGRHAVAVRFDMHRDARLASKATPAFKKGNAVREALRTHVR